MEREIKTMTTVRGAARYVGCTEKHIQEMIQSGTIRTIKVGPSGERVAVEDLEKIRKEARQ